MISLGTHLLLELKECNSKALNDLKKVQDILISAAKEVKATIIETSFHKFSPFGISGIVVIAESHISIHTWPEHSYAAIDIFTCGQVLKPEIAARHLIHRFQCKDPSIVEMKRGLFLAPAQKSPQKTVKEVVGYGRAKELQMVP